MLIPTIAPYLLPKIIPRIKTQLPKVKLYLIEDKTSVLIEKLQSADLDGAILALPVTGHEFMQTSLYDEEFFFAVSSQNPLSKKKSIQLSDLNTCHVLLLEEGHCLRDQALAICQTEKSAMIENFQATSLETLRHMVAIDMGVTLMPELAKRSDDNIAYLPFQSPKPSRQVGLMTRKDGAKNHLLQEISQIINLHVAT